MLQIPLACARTYEKRGFKLIGIVYLNNKELAIMSHYLEGIA